LHTIEPRFTRSSTRAKPTLVAIDVRPTVLVVDDGPANCARMKASLESQGYAVEAAPSREEALRAFARRAPDCVLLEIRTPGVEAIALGAAIRRLPGGADVPILFVTASRAVDTFDRAVRAGCDDFLTRPFLQADLGVRLGAVIEARGLDAGDRSRFELVRRQRDALLRVQLEREELTAFVAHDMKSPVNAIELHAQFALRDPQLPEAVRDSLAQIRSEVRELTRMIANLADVSRAETERLEPAMAEVALGAQVRAAFDSLRLTADAVGVTLEARLAVQSVRADARLLGRTLENLVDNALRASPAEGRVVVSSSRLGADVHLRVRDFGKGIPSELRERVFDRYVPADARARVPSAGRGLGLAFCKLAVEAHGGRIWVEEASPGAILCVSLPDTSPSP
jgi:two-component system, sensor histidine kinase and response regulator